MRKFVLIAGLLALAAGAALARDAGPTALDLDVSGATPAQVIDSATGAFMDEGLQVGQSGSGSLSSVANYGVIYRVMAASSPGGTRVQFSAGVVSRGGIIPVNGTQRMFRDAWARLVRLRSKIAASLGATVTDPPTDDDDEDEDGSARP